MSEGNTDSISRLKILSVPDPNKVKVLMVTYMRGGSSFLGELFAQNPDAYYMFEPLDAFYASMFGLGFGNHPTELMMHPNGSFR